MKEQEIKMYEFAKTTPEDEDLSGCCDEKDGHCIKFNRKCDGCYICDSSEMTDEI